MERKIYTLAAVAMVVGVIFCITCLGCSDVAATYPSRCREDAVPSDVMKRSPETDQHPPILHSDEFEQPTPLPYPINTAGLEDSPFILPDGNTLYFFFTPDARVPPEQQILDEVSGVWVSQRQNGTWTKPERVWLQQPGKLALDGAVCIYGDEMWFASAREGYTGVNMFTARLRDGKWVDWTYVGDRLMKEMQIGEVHLYGDDLYFHSDREGGLGEYDIWITTRDGAHWSDPVNFTVVNSEVSDALPFLSSDGSEFWFTRTHKGTPAVFRSLRQGDTWKEPELILSQFAGEPTLDDYGNLYFVHHYFEHGIMIEADIYVARRKKDDRI